MRSGTCAFKNQSAMVQSLILNIHQRTHRYYHERKADYSISLPDYRVTYNLYQLMHNIQLIISKKVHRDCHIYNTLIKITKY